MKKEKKEKTSRQMLSGKSLKITNIKGVDGLRASMRKREK